MGESAERETLDRLVSTHMAETLRFAVRLTNDLDWAEEILGEALMHVATSWRSFRGEAKFRTWLFRIVINVFRDQVRRKRPAERLDVDLPDGRSVDPADEASAGELSRLVAARVSALPARQREVLVLVTYEALSPPEVADVLGISVQNVYANLHAARQRLHRELASYLMEKQDDLG